MHSRQEGAFRQKQEPQTQQLPCISDVHRSHDDSLLHDDCLLHEYGVICTCRSELCLEKPLDKQAEKATGHCSVTYMVSTHGQNSPFKLWGIWSLVCPLRLQLIPSMLLLISSQLSLAILQRWDYSCLQIYHRDQMERWMEDPVPLNNYREENVIRRQSFHHSSMRKRSTYQNLLYSYYCTCSLPYLTITAEVHVAEIHTFSFPFMP